MDPAPPPLPSSPAYHNRRTGLVIFGVIEIVLGAFFLLSVPIGAFGQVTMARQAGAEVNVPFLIGSFLPAIGAAVALVWLGIGSIKARRWARALLLCLGWIGLVVGVLSLVLATISLGSLDEVMRQQGQAVNPAVLLFVKIFAITFTAIIYVAYPAVLILFYRSPHVKLTCEHLDPVERWTDRCPLPVLSMCILQTFGAAAMLAMFQFGAAMPFAGLLVTGWPARLLWFGFIALSAYGAWGFYQLNSRAWLIYTVGFILFGLSTSLSLLRIDLMDYYRAVGMPDYQLKQVTLSPLMRHNLASWISAVSIVLLGGFAVYLRRYFPPSGDRSVVVR